MMSAEELKVLRGSYEVRRPEYRLALGVAVEFGLQEGAKIVDFGAGDASLETFAKEVNYPHTYQGYDLTAEVESVAVMDLEKTPYPIKDNEYDFGFCIETLEHLQDPLAAVRDMERCCRNLLITVPTEKSLIKDYHEDPTHIYNMSREVVDRMGFYKIYNINSISHKKPYEVSDEKDANIILGVYYGYNL